MGRRFVDVLLAQLSHEFVIFRGFRSFRFCRSIGCTFSFAFPCTFFRKGWYFISCDSKFRGGSALTSTPPNPPVLLYWLVGWVAFGNNCAIFRSGRKMATLNTEPPPNSVTGLRLRKMVPLRDSRHSNTVTASRN